ncbi:ABC transporter substrate-binding protein [Cellulosimicrobium funkei]|uniref:ABC transporter substrate-binding protein n=1 Tax=Cellulosimicrobium funkei TaxID=264251 RepID=UPI0030FAA4C7
MSHRTAPGRPARRRRARAAATALSAVTALALTACAGPSVAGADGAGTAGDEATAEAVDWSAVEPASEITWWSNHPGTSQEIEQELIDRFEEESGITVNLVTAGANYDEVAQRFQAASQTDELPDVVIASDVWWFRYHLNDQILPLDDVLEFVDADADDFQPALYADYEYDDQHWAVPYARSTPLFYYNKDLWTAAGLPDRGPETWAELEEWDASLKPLVPSGGSTLGLSTGPSWGAWWFENMIWGQGGAYSDGFDLTLDSEESVAGGQFLHDLFHEKGVATLSADDAMVDFSSGLIASTIGSTGSLKGALDAASFEVGTAYLPDGPDGGGTPTGGTGLAIPASKSPEQQLAAAMFLAFLTNTENTAYFSQNTGYMPVRTSAVESDTMKAIYEATPQFRTAVDQLADKARPQDDARVFIPGADALLNEAIEQIVIEGADPAAAFESVAPRIETAYSENVEPYL